MDLLERQLKLERDAADYSYNRLMKEINARISSGQADELAEGKFLLVHSIDAVAEKIKEYFAKDIRGKMKLARDLVQSEFQDDPKDLAYIILVTIVRSISKDATVTTMILIRQLIKAISDSILVRRLEKNNNTLSAFIDKRYKTRSDKYRQQQKIKIARKQESLNNADLDDISTYLGGLLLDLVIKSGVNIIETKNVVSKGKRTQHVVYTEECFKMVLQSRERLLAEYRKFPILLMPPKDWTGFHGSGGYYNEDLNKLTMIKCRIGSRKLLEQFLEANPSQYIYDTLNVLQKTAWRVNRRVYDVMSYVFDNNLVDEGSAKNNPYLLGGLPYNGILEPEDFINIHNYGELQTEGRFKGLPKERADFRRYFKDLDFQRDITISNTGRAIMMNLVLYNAKEYVNEPEFYFSYQYDFRGRIYPIQQHLQPQGKGQVKALLEFAKGCKIENDEQLEWFLIHGANCYGYDKEPYAERVSKMREKQDEIVAIAEDPFKNRNLWKDADEPYLYLAWCFEYADYLKDPENFESHIAVSLDATCSGIQIYSGLLLDADGASAVNVIGDERKDIYQQVANKVNDYLNKGEYLKVVSYTTSDGKEHEETTLPTANSLKNNITRALTKRNTMTQPYSVTKYGMYEQIKAELQTLENANKKFWIGDTWLVAKMITDLNDRAIVDTVKGARVGQEYLKSVTADLVKKGRWVFYTTPITQFPVLQKIHKTKMEQMSTPIGRLSFRTTIKEINPQKMVSGIAPNFIHSLDAVLLSTTVLKLKEAGCDNFHMIHDSYGVPINMITHLNKSVREAFVELFRTNPLASFVSQVNPDFEQKPESIMINTLDLDNVLNSKYIFS